MGVPPVPPGAADPDLPLTRPPPFEGDRTWITSLGRTGAQVSPLCLGTMMFGSYLPVADIRLSDKILDRIDELVVPGVTINPDGNSYGAHELTTSARRREGIR